MSSPPTSSNPVQDSYYKSYSEFSKTLRTWFVAYGIGGPIVLLSNDKAWGWLMQTGKAHKMGLLFLLGGAIQIFSALLNKHSMWYLYFEEFSPSSPPRAPYRISYWYSDQGWIDVVFDLATLALFGWATWLAFSTIMGAPAQIFLDSKS